MLKDDDEEFEYRVVEWRNFERENVRATFDELLADGWEIDGGGYTKAGWGADLSMQGFKRAKKEDEDLIQLVKDRMEDPETKVDPDEL